MEFDFVSKTEDCLVLEAVYNEETLKQYPFKFKVVATYKLSGKMLEGSYEIFNLDAKTMPYGFGLHNGFYCVDEGETIDDVYVEFDTAMTIAKPSRVGDGFMDFANRIPVIENSKILGFTDGLFNNNAPVMDTISFKSLKLMNKKRGQILDYHFSDGFKMFNFWRAMYSPFLCIEPWTSQIGLYPYYKTLEECENTKFLEANKSKTYTFTVNV